MSGGKSAQRTAGLLLLFAVIALTSTMRLQGRPAFWAGLAAGVLAALAIVTFVKMKKPAEGE